MRLEWPPSAEDIAAADAAPWNGPFARFSRPLPYLVLARTWFAVAALEAIAAVGVIIVNASLTTTVAGHRYMTCVVVLLLAISVSLPLFVLFSKPTAVRRYTPLLLWTLNPPQALLVCGAIVTMGPEADSLLIFFAQAPIFSFYLMRAVPSLLVMSATPIEYGLVLWWRGDMPDPFSHWLVVTIVVLGTGIIVGSIATRSEQLAESEREARAELAALNNTLEARVSSQVAELEGLNRLRSFLAPSVADAVAGQDYKQIFAPHRRKIAVLFCDLRGFTAFTHANEPEEVMSILGQYFEAIGEVLDARGVTVAKSTGDGVMAFSGDPVQIENPAQVALEAAIALQLVIGPMTERWQRNGHQLGLGCGVAYGYATLGVVGTGARSDYTPMGSVVNLAARLCAKAEAGQVLIDHATHVAAPGMPHRTQIEGLDLKGFGTDMLAYAVYPAGRPNTHLR